MTIINKNLIMRSSPFRLGLKITLLKKIHKNIFVKAALFKRLLSVTLGFFYVIFCYFL